MTKLLKYTFVFVSMLIISEIKAQTPQDKKEIQAILKRQMKYWNEGNIPQFMEDYWKSDSLMFIGKNGVVYGYQATLERYLKSYPDRESMGSLQFDIIKSDFHSPEICWLLGKWHLTRKTKGDIGGYFTLIFRKINNRWVIVADHTS